MKCRNYIIKRLLFYILILFGVMSIIGILTLYLPFVCHLCSPTTFWNRYIQFVNMKISFLSYLIPIVILFVFILGLFSLIDFKECSNKEHLIWKY
ncbi:hypothetical protein LCGC14_2860100 [marine sediment metagenome]|uniref:Uncharacterized protein n=1 Tax=marine sediment metagenome TaxID=412755 RepID=A0A0F9AWX8_9ZZZZ